MAAGSGPRSRVVFAREARERARYQGTYSVVALVLAAGVFAFRGPQWISWLLIVVGAYFLIGCAVDLVKYRYNAAPLDGQRESATPERPDGESDDVVERVDLGEGQSLRFEYDPALLRSHRECIEALRESIVANGSGFLEKFARFKLDQARKYPKYAQQIAELQIESVTVFRTKRKNCLGRVRFAGELDEVWRADYVSGAFSDLIWN